MATYAQAGVDVLKHRKAMKGVWAKIVSTWPAARAKPVDLRDHYAGLLDLGGEHLLALHTDGVGTKMAVAAAMKNYRTVGIDCVAMCVNDLICVGATPLAMVDYVATPKLDEAVLDQILDGLVVGCKKVKIALLGGETATMATVAEWDLAGMVVGTVPRERVITGKTIRDGDLIIGIESSGLHSNGYTLARKIFFEEQKLKPSAKLPGLAEPLGKALLEPTALYVEPVLGLLGTAELHGLGHITGGAFSKLNRIRPKGLQFNLNHLPPLPPLFENLHKLGQIDEEELYRTFNCGVGLVVVAPESEEQKIKKAFSKHGQRAAVLGNVTKGDGVKLATPTGRLLLY